MSKDYLIMIPAGIIGLIIVLLMIFMPIHYSKTSDKVTGVITGDRIKVKKPQKEIGKFTI